MKHGKEAAARARLEGISAKQTEEQARLRAPLEEDRKQTAEETRLENAAEQRRLEQEEKQATEQVPLKEQEHERLATEEMKQQQKLEEKRQAAAEQARLQEERRWIRLQIHFENGDVHQIQAEGYVTVRQLMHELHEFLCATNVLARGGGEQEWTTLNKRTNAVLELDRTLDQHGLVDGDELYISRQNRAKPPKGASLKRP